ncbi:MAG TPA: glycosyltransferase [Chitinophagaceae bacterium]|nr:glycosyltransferase [Chitinophagaceae bacterium]
MNHSLMENKLRKSRILIAPLDWGLGHATRCIPIVHELLNANFDVWLAGEGAQETLLKKEFPALPVLPLKGYRILYSKSGSSLLWRIILQGPQLRKAIRDEHRWLKKMMNEYNFDAVISDNRYGLYHKNTFCVFITHQLMIKTFWGKWTEKYLQKRNYHFINRFSECWVPDNKDENNFAGELSHPGKKPAIPVKYIGLLSRMEKKNIEPEKKHLLILLSGPEPQRSILENIIVRQIAHYYGSATILRGLPSYASMIPSTNSIHFYNHLPAEELSKEMARAEFIIARSGYSTVMDIVKLQKKGILIPTPGQTEQEYLGKYLLEKQVAFSCTQKEFSLEEALIKAKDFPFKFPDFNSQNKLKEVVEKMEKLYT